MSGCLYVYVCICMYMYVYVCICMYMYMEMYMYMYMYVYVYVYICMHICMYICMYVCMCESDVPADMYLVVTLVWLMTKKSELPHCAFPLDDCSLVGLEPKGQHCIDPLWLES